MPLGQGGGRYITIMYLLSFRCKPPIKKEDQAQLSPFALLGRFLATEFGLLGVGLPQPPIRIAPAVHLLQLLLTSQSPAQAAAHWLAPKRASKGMFATGSVERLSNGGPFSFITGAGPF